MSVAVDKATKGLRGVNGNGVIGVNGDGGGGMGMGMGTEMGGEAAIMTEQMDIGLPNIGDCGGR